MSTTMLYVYAAKGAQIKPGTLVGDCACRADYVTLPNGDAVGVVHATSARARMKLQGDPAVTVLPPLHRPLQPAHVTLFAYAGAAQTDTTYDLGMKLFQYHRMPWFHPEEGPDAHDAIQDLLPD